MSENAERLDAIEARSVGLTDLCAEHLRQSIRHVQRNCDIDCNTHEDDYEACKQPDRYDGDRMAAVLADIPFLLDLARKQRAQLDAVAAVADEWEMNAGPGTWAAEVLGPQKVSVEFAVRSIREALEAKP